MRSLCIASLEVAHLWSISVSDMDPGGASRNPTLQGSSSSDEDVPAAQHVDMEKQGLQRKRKLDW